MSLSNEQRIICKIITEKDIRPILDRGVDGTWFYGVDHRDAIKFILTHYDKYGIVPTKATMMSHFGSSYKIIRVSESMEYLLDAMAEHCQWMHTKGTSLEVVELLKEKDTAGAVAELESGLKRVRKFSGGGGFSSEQQEENDLALRRERAREAARRTLLAEEMELARGERIRRTAREFAAVPKVHAIIEDTLAAEVNLLHGPSGAGKSLLARDWALHVASGTPWRGCAIPEMTDVLWLASEGLHDFPLRWRTHPLWDPAADHVWILDSTINLTNPHDVDWLLKEYTDIRPGLVVLDVIYGFGVGDDSASKDALPVIGAMKKISKEWDAATLAIGHPGNDKNSQRMRGSSMWGQLSYTDWHMSEGQLICKKSKVANAEDQGGDYVAAYPDLRWLASSIMTDADRKDIIRKDIATHPKDSQRARAKRLAPALGVGDARARQLISAVIKEAEDD